jgi:hypothetical protein
VYRKKCSCGNFDHRYNVSPIHLHACVGNFMKVVRTCTLTSYEVNCDCQKFEKHCFNVVILLLSSLED